MSVVEVVDALCRRDVAAFTVDQVRDSLGDVARVQAWLDEVKVAHARRLTELADQQPMIRPAGVLSGGQLCSRREANTTLRRAGILADAPALQGALAAGRVSGTHVDALARAVQALDEQQRVGLLADGDELATLASEVDPDEFERLVRQRARELQAATASGVDADVELLRRQQAAARLRLWHDVDTGMYNLAGELDPLSGIRLRNKLDRVLRTLFASPDPDPCPSNPREKLDHLRALALMGLVDSRSGDVQQQPEDITLVGHDVEVTVIIDFDTIVKGVHEHTVMDAGDADVRLPLSTYMRLACIGEIIPVVLDTDGVPLQLGRTARLANRDQRRALRAVYATCGVEGCAVDSRYCQPHHIHWWEHGGDTDIENLIPLCSYHHHMVHEGGWQLLLHPDRSLTITYPDGTSETHACPRRGHPQRPTRCSSSGPPDRSARALSARKESA